MPRPKGSKNKVKIEPIKYSTWDSAKLQIVNDPEHYELKNIYWLLNNVRKRLERDPTAIKPDDWIKLNSDFKEKMKQYKRNRKIEDRVRTRVDTPKVEKDGNPEPTPGLGDKEPFSMGT